MKWVKRIIIVFVLLVIIGVVALWLGVNRVVTKGVEVAGTYALGVPTRVDSVSVGWLSSSVGIRDLRIGNPEGYKTDRLMALGHGKVACNVGSLLSDEVVVKEILIDEPELTIELKPGLPPKSNLGDLLAKLKSGEPTPEQRESEKKFKIDLIRVTNTKVRFHLLAGQTVDKVLPDIELKDIKNADGTPVLLADVFRQVLTSMATSAATEGKGIVPDDALKNLGSALGVARELLGSQVGKTIGEGLGKTLKGLLGKDKEED